MKSILTVSLLIGASSVLVFFVPYSLSLLSFSGYLFFQLELWRLFTFPFAHAGTSHLVQNVIALAAASLLSFELELNVVFFLSVFFAAGMVVAVSEAVFFPYLVIAGMSLGIYALFGSLSVKGSNLVPAYISIPLLGSSVFLRYVLEAPKESLLKQSLFHLSGFIAGILVFLLLVKISKKVSLRKRRVLQGDG